MLAKNEGEIMSYFFEGGGEGGIMREVSWDLEKSGLRRFACDDSGHPPNNAYTMMK